ncbi:MAG: hypothetical protein QOF67_1650 [Mycobacterium sp.]|jgi:hypothetical protein|nr:hypothetical protein [Mycobacterium sp.]
MGDLLMASQFLQPSPTPRERRRRNRSHAGTTSLFRYQLNVIGASVADVVQSAGGWLFDRRMAGWDVNILLSEHDDVRALRILGATAVDLRSGLASFPRGPERAAALAVAADLLAIDASIEEEVLEAVRSGLTEVALWGDSRPTNVGSQVDSTEYRLSAAARVFKGHALAAAGLVDREVRHTERLYRSGYQPLDSDLIQVG